MNSFTEEEQKELAVFLFWFRYGKEIFEIIDESKTTQI